MCSTSKFIGFILDVSVCREWLVIEDGALAHQLQDQESKFTRKKVCLLRTANSSFVYF
jgi:hypothetical protein